MKTDLQPTNREAWLEARKAGIGASDAPSVIGANPWKSPYTLWAEKAGVIEPDDLGDREFVQWGNILEAPIREETSRRLNCEIHHGGPFEIRQSSDHPFMLCTLDGEVHRANHEIRALFTQHGMEQPIGPGTVQIKTTNAYAAKDWEGDWPLYYQVQCNHEAIVTGYRWGILAVLIGGQELRLFPFNRNERFCAALIQAEAEFWRRVVEHDPPEVDGSDSTAGTLAKLFPEDDGSTIELPDEATLLDAQRQEAKERIKELEATVTQCDNRLREMIGEHAIGLLPDGGKYTLKTQHRAEYMVPASSFRVLRRCK